MIDHTPETITDAVLEQMATTENPRLKQIMESAVRHLHAFARDVNMTPAEWIYGIEFLTRVGHMCSPARQEFILLSDTLGLSTLVNTLHDKTAVEEATHTSLLGPFFRESAPQFSAGDSISRRDTSPAIVLWGQVTDCQGRPLPGAEITVWQTASDGRYDMQDGPDVVDCRGRFTADENGRYLVRSVRPLGYYIPMDGPVGEMITAQGRHGKRPAHIHFLIAAPGHRELVTALYLAGDEHLHDDVVFGASGDLVAELRADDPDCPIKGEPSVRFDFTLSKESGTGLGRVGADPAALVRAAE